MALKCVDFCKHTKSGIMICWTLFGWKELTNLFVSLYVNSLVHMFVHFSHGIEEGTFQYTDEGISLLTTDLVVPLQLVQQVNSYTHVLTQIQARLRHNTRIQSGTERWNVNLTHFWFTFMSLRINSPR